MIKNPIPWPGGARYAMAFTVRRAVADGTWTPRIPRPSYYDGPLSGVCSGAGVLPGRAHARPRRNT
jgi:hypothetical protein